MTLLSICIPTYNRAAQVEALLRSILTCPGDYELCVQDDGSRDETAACLTRLRDEMAGNRFQYASGPNRGRAAALTAAVAMAQGRFIMLFDDDDTLSPKGLATVLKDCAADLPTGCAGYIYHLANGEAGRLGGAFPVLRSNLLALRADHRVEGDKKEVVLAEALRPAMTPPGQARRVPTSLYWARLSLDFDVLCRNEIIGGKTYNPGGMTASIRKLKSQNALPLMQLNRIKLQAFFRGRYRSVRYAAKALAGVVWYGLNALMAGTKRRLGEGRSTRVGSKD